MNTFFGIFGIFHVTWASVFYVNDSQTAIFHDYAGFPNCAPQEKRFLKVTCSLKLPPVWWVLRMCGEGEGEIGPHPFPPSPSNCHNPSICLAQRRGFEAHAPFAGGHLIL